MTYNLSMLVLCDVTTAYWNDVIEGQCPSKICLLLPYINTIKYVFIFKC